MINNLERASAFSFLFLGEKKDGNMSEIKLIETEGMWLSETFVSKEEAIKALTQAFNEALCSNGGVAIFKKQVNELLVEVAQYRAEAARNA